LMPQIQAPEIAERLRRKFSIVGQSSIDTIAPELVGVIIVDEIIPNQQQTHAAISTVLTGDTADIAEFGVRNLDETRLLVIDRVLISAAAIILARVRQGGPGGTVTAGGIPSPLDRRNPLTSAAVGLPAVDLNTTAGAGAILFQKRAGANFVADFSPNIVLETPANAGAVAADRFHCDTNQAALQIIFSVKMHWEDPGDRRFSV